ncbi:PREDICTED: uncharacterized protein LOC106751327 [Dinoponera quadriceps]|uniref:Uncharacterized protein LOC106751327 n=1 Tax=Dinoponera quadriceps TaxID=609295 RepID=A0A6P3Y9T3_DINQU|nr:PREDICTED: uncharacterized protein LOC106751327 [Dinoponera quadriceps]
MYDTIHTKIFSNGNYKNDIKYTLELNRFFFRLLGIWPYTKMNFPYLENLKRVSLILVFYFLLFCDFVPTILYVFIEEKDVRIKIKLVGPMIVTFVSIVKYIDLMLSNNQIKCCLARVDNDWRNVADMDARDSMVNKAKIGRRMVMLCAAFMYLSGLFFRTVMPLSKKKIVTAQNLTIRHLPCPAYFVFFDVQASPAYEIVFFIQFFSGFVKYTITIAICSLAALFAMHICAQLEILMASMNNLVNERDVKNLGKRLALTVEHQIRTRE